MPPLFCQEVKMTKQASKYRVEVEYWTRSQDGDDWVTGSHWYYYDTLGEAVFKAGNPFSNTKDVIESRVLDTSNSRHGELIWKKDWHDNKVVDYTTIPDVDYHNREYDA